MTSLSKKPSANHLNTSTLTDFHGQKRKVSASDLTSKAIAQQAAENFVTEYGTPTKKARVESEDTMRKSKLVGRTRRSPSKRSGLAKSTATAAAGCEYGRKRSRFRSDTDASVRVQLPADSVSYLRSKSPSFPLVDD